MLEVRNPRESAGKGKLRLSTPGGPWTWPAEWMPLTPREGMAVLASVGLCSLELAEAPRTNQKMGPSVHCPGQSVLDKSGSKLSTKCSFKPHVLLSCQRAWRGIEGGCASVFRQFRLPIGLAS